LSAVKIEPVLVVAFWITPFLVLESATVYFGVAFGFGVSIFWNQSEIDLIIVGKKSGLCFLVSVIMVAS
jgi:hypothetical protein